MKNSVFFIFLCLFLSKSNILKAQYADNKFKYNTQEYRYTPNDRYNPAIAGISSYFLPGLGQIYCDETNRGLRFMAGSVGSMLVIITGGIITGYKDLINQPDNTGPIILTTGAISAFGIQIWSIVDAIKVAKVNNMAIRDKKATGYLLSINPCTINLNDNSKINPGLAAKLTF